MKKIVLLFILFANLLHAELIKAYPSVELLRKNIPIVDIRTPAEWRQTGIIKGAIPIMFFDERGNYDVRKFLDELNKRVDTSKPFAVICHVGNRSAIVADFLSKQLGYIVIDLVGGMEEAKRRGLPMTPYM